VRRPVPFTAFHQPAALYKTFPGFIPFNASLYYFYNDIYNNAQKLFCQQDISFFLYKFSLYSLLNFTKNENFLLILQTNRI